MKYKLHTYFVVTYRSFVSCALIIFLNYTTHAQTPAFVDVSSQIPNLPQVDVGSTDWGDYDNDGRLDLLIAGRPQNLGAVIKLYHNTAQGFVDVTSSVVGLRRAEDSTVKWCDYDNDGRLDFMVMGDYMDLNFHIVNDLFHNTGTSFVKVNSIFIGNFIPVVGTIQWVDYNHDGFQDIQLRGGTFGGHGDQLFRNNQGQNFLKIGHTVPLLNSESVWEETAIGTVKWIDYDSDGQMDVFFINSNDKAYLYHKTTQGYEDVSYLVSSIPGTREVWGDSVWGDYDNDGRVDIAFAGTGVKLYRNTAQGFVNMSSLIPNDPLFIGGTLAFGDYDNDGRLDLFVSGSLSSGKTTSKLYRNAAEGFTDVSNVIPDLPQLQGGSVNWVDYDKDGRLDLLITGLSQSGVRTTRLYRNISTPVNTPPNVPAGLNASPGSDGKSITFTWQPSSDAQTPTPGLSYNLYVGDKPGSQTAMSAMADASSGLRRVVREGNCQATTYTLNGLLPNKTYYWSVQAIDGAWSGSAFAPQQSVCTCQPLSITSVTTQSCQALSTTKRRVTFTPNYSGASDKPISFSVVNELAPTSSPGPYSLDLYTDNPVVQLAAQQDGQSTVYVYDWLAACLGKEPVISTNLSITSVTTQSCQVLSATKRRVTFTPNYNGASDKPISFSVVNELAPTSSPGPYSLDLYTDNPVVQLAAQQGGQSTVYAYKWLTVCPNQARSSAEGNEPSLQVRILGNPVENRQVDIEINGVPNQSVQVQLSDQSGRVISQQFIDQTNGSQTVSVPTGAGKGVLILRIKARSEEQRLKIIVP